MKPSLVAACSVIAVTMSLRRSLIVSLHVRGFEGRLADAARERNGKRPLESIETISIV
jgi:hypothetical protein